MANIGIIGGADGPTTVFVTGFIPSWVNFFGLVFVLLILVPNILWAAKVIPGGSGPIASAGKCSGRRLSAAKLLEQLGRYGCMALMVFGFGFYHFGFPSPEALVIYLVGNSVLILAYWIAWIPFRRTQRRGNALILALLPCLVFLLSGICLEHWALVCAAVIFGAAHTAITVHHFWKNHS